VITIRQAGESDRPFILSLAERLADFDCPPWRSAQEIAEGDRRALAEALDAPSSDNGLFVALLDGQPAGCLLMWTLDDYFTGERHAHISVIAVTREAEGHGVGRALMDHAERWARDRGHARITLSVFEGNRRARALYERAGFQVEMRRYLKPLSE
jgi:ribosomal protein S18 acetylase RimI-like enzyme